MRAPELVLVDDIVVQKRMRHADDQKVSALAASMRDIGLRTPISVRVVEEMELDGEIVHGVPVLITGATRLAAAKRLGWEKIDCFIVDSDDIDAQLWEIDENLARAELSPAEVAEHTARRKALWDQRKVSGQVDPKPQGGRPKGFAQSTAEATGRSKRDINRAVARGEKIAPDVLERIKSNPDLNKGVVLDQLARMSHEEQRETVASGRRPISPPAPPLDEFEAFNKWCGEMNRLWSRAPREWRERWLEQKDRAVFDRTRSGRAA